MVLQLITCSPKGKYDTVAALIQQADPLPSFNKAPFQFLLEETRKSKQALVAQHSNSSPTTNSTALAQSDQQQQRGGGGRGSGRNYGGCGGKGRGRGGKSQTNASQQQPQQAQSAWQGQNYGQQ
uniref:Uncharacterized protein n=1 Tax=Chenopodium quinoa TaxID=63459 RepID=A0A803MHA5_CHEQI